MTLLNDDDVLSTALAAISTTSSASMGVPSGVSSRSVGGDKAGLGGGLGVLSINTEGLDERFIGDNNNMTEALDERSFGGISGPKFGTSGTTMGGAFGFGGYQDRSTKSSGVDTEGLSLEPSDGSGRRNAASGQGQMMKVVSEDVDNHPGLYTQQHDQSNNRCSDGLTMGLSAGGKQVFGPDGGNWLRGETSRY
jgi:hypothetical protein